MDYQSAGVYSNLNNAVPEIMITAPSPLVQRTESAAEKAKPTPEETAKQDPQVTENSASVVKESVANAVSGQQIADLEVESSGEFKPAQECNECVVAVPEVLEPASEEVATTDSSETDQEDFRTVSTSRCCQRILGYYEKLWNVLHRGYTLPFWILLLTLPLSAGIMGSIYMYSCPAAPAMATLIFIIGIFLLASISLRIYLILYTMTGGDESWKTMLQTLLLASTFFTFVFFVTESVAYWQMDSTSSPGTNKYCDQRFLNYAFLWNCVMSVVMVPLIIFPA